MALSDGEIKSLNGTIKKIKKNSDLLHDPRMKDFTDYVKKLGGKIPAKSSKKTKDTDGDDLPDLEEVKEPKVEAKEEAKKEAKEEEPEAPVESSEPEESTDEEEDPNKVEGDEVNEEELTVEIKADDWEISEADDEKSWDLKNEGDEIYEKDETKIEETLKKYKEALELNPCTSFLNHRAKFFLKIGRPNACIFDCGQSLKINPNSAKAHKLSGYANRKLGNYLEAYKNLSAANNCDYSPEVFAEIKELKEKADKETATQTRKRNRRKKNALKARRKLVRERNAAIAKAKKKAAEEEAKKKMGGGFPGGFPGGMPGGFPGGMPGGFPGGMPGGFPGGMPGGKAGAGGMPGMPNLPPEFMNKMMSDPEILQAMQEPGVREKLLEIQKDPSKIASITDPKMKRLVQKLQKLFADVKGSEGGGGGCGSAGKCPDTGCGSKPKSSSKDWNEVD